MSLNVSHESVTALKTMSTRLKELQEDLKSGASTLDTVFQENEKGLGQHSASISELIQELKDATNDASGPVKKLIRRLLLSADVRQKHIDNDHYSGAKK